MPGFLATTNKLDVASGFAFKADQNHVSGTDGMCRVLIQTRPYWYSRGRDTVHSPEQPRALWHVKLDPRGKDDAQYRVQHMTFVDKTLITGEGAPPVRVGYTVYVVSHLHAKY